MTFQANVPQPGDLISTSQSDILNNFQKIGTVYPTDHVNFNDPGAGFHKRVTFDAPIANPNEVAPVTSLYTKAAPTTAISDLYYQVGALASDVSQVTGGGITAAAWCQFNGTTVGTNPPTVGYNVSTITRNSTGNYTINFTRSFSSTSYCVLITAGSANSYTSISRSAASCIITNLIVPSDSTDINVVFFGTLA